MFSSLWTSQEIDKQGFQYDSDVGTAGSTDGGGGMQLGPEQQDFWIQWFQNSIFGCAPNAEGSMSEENFSVGSPNTTLAPGNRAMHAPHPKRMGDTASLPDTGMYFPKSNKSIAASSTSSQFVALSATLQDIQTRVSWAPKQVERLAGALVAVKRTGGDLGTSAMELLSEFTAPAVSAVENYIPAIHSLKRGWQRLVAFNEPDPIERRALQLVYEQSVTTRPAPHITQNYLHEIVAECKKLAEEVKGAPPGSLLESMAKCLEDMVGVTNVPDEQVEAVRTLWKHLVASWTDLHWDKLETLPLNPGSSEIFCTDMCDLWNRLVLLNRLIVHLRNQPKMPPVDTIVNPYPFISQIPSCIMDIPIYLRRNLNINEIDIQRSLLTACAGIYKRHFPERNLSDFKIWYKEQINVPKHPRMTTSQEGWDFDDQLLEAVGNEVEEVRTRGSQRAPSECPSNASTRRTNNTFFNLFGAGTTKGGNRTGQQQRQMEDVPLTSELWEEVWRLSDVNREVRAQVFNARALGDRLMHDIRRLPAEEFVQQMIAVYLCMVFRDVITITLVKGDELPKLQGFCFNFRALIEQGFANNWSGVCLEGIIEAMHEFDRALHGQPSKKYGYKQGSSSSREKGKGRGKDKVEVKEKEIDEDDWTLVDVA